MIFQITSNTYSLNSESQEPTLNPLCFSYLKALLAKSTRTIRSFPAVSILSIPLPPLTWRGLRPFAAPISEPQQRTSTSLPHLGTGSLSIWTSTLPGSQRLLWQVTCLISTDAVAFTCFSPVPLLSYVRRKVGDDGGARHGYLSGPDEWDGKEPMWVWNGRWAKWVWNGRRTSRILL